MISQNQNSEMSKTVKGLFILFPAMLVGLLGGFTVSAGGKQSFITGFTWGVGVALVGIAVIALGMFAWDKIKKEAEMGKLYPFIIISVAVAIAVSGYLAINLGSPTCVESDTDNRGSSCTQYANDGYAATSDQKWNKFWSTLPVTVIIASLIAVIVRNHIEKEKKQ